MPSLLHGIVNTMHGDTSENIYCHIFPGNVELPCLLWYSEVQRENPSSMEEENVLSFL